MQNLNRLPRALLFITLLTGLLGGMLAPALVDEPVSAAPMDAPLLGCPASTIAQWTFTGDVVTPSTGSGTFSSGTGLIPAMPPYTFAAGEITAENNAISFTGLNTALLDDTAYIGFKIDTTGKSSINFNFKSRITTTGPTVIDLYYSTDNWTTFTFYSSINSTTFPPLINDVLWHTYNFDLSSITALDNKPNVEIRLFAYGASASGGTWRIDNVTISDICIPPSADLSLTQAVNDVAPSVGDNILLTLTVSNVGPDLATSVVIKDLLPPGLTYVAHSSGETYDKDTGLWLAGTVPVGAINARILNITARVTTSGTKTNLAEVWQVDQSDPDSTPGNNSTTEDDDDSATVVAAKSNALNITNTVNNSNPNVGTNIVFTITVNNPSTNPYPATNVAVAALLPPSGLTYISYSSTSGTTYSGSSGIWTIGNLAIGASAVINITAKVITSNPPPYSAIVSSNEFFDNTATVIINNPLSGEADLSLTHDPIAISSSIADQLTLKLRLHNAGPDKATNTQVKDLLPEGLNFVSYTSSVGTYNSTTGIWVINEIAIGADATLNIAVKVDSDGTSTKNFAEVWQSEQYDPDSTPGNGDIDVDDDTSLEVPIADLSITQTVDIAGSNAVFTIRVSNAGPDGATGVIVTTKLPTLTSAYTFVSYGSTLGTSYIASTGVWTVGNLSKNTSATLTITTTTVGSLLVNWAQVTAVNEVDPDSVPGNCSNTALSCKEDDDAGAPSADLYMMQSVNNPNPDVGANVVFTITVSNAGIAGTTNVQVKDTLPSGLTYVSDTGGGAYNKTSGIWIVGTLTSSGADASKTLTITATAATNGIKTNWAEVWRSDESDPDSTPGNGSTTEDDDADATITSYRSIIINEVAWAGTAASPDDEWIELHNPSNASINITGWTLKSTSGSLNIILSGTISSGGYFLLERGDNFTVSNVTADQIYTGALLNLLSDNGEVLTLADGSAHFIDTANGNGDAWPRGSLSPNYGSMERQGIIAESDRTWVTNLGNPKNGIDANNGSIYGTPRAKNSTGSALPTPMPKATSTPAPLVGRMIINEYLPRAGFDWNQDGQVNVQDEFIEIKNLGPVDVIMNGWKLDDEVDQGSEPFLIPSMTVKPGQRVIFYGSTTGILLSDGGDTVRLLNSSGKVIDAHTYSIAEEADRSWCRFPDAINNIYWNKNCLPTPGLANALAGEAPSEPPGTGLEVPLCQLPDTLLPDYLLAECSVGFGGGIWRPMYWDEGGWLSQYPIYDDKSKWLSFVE